MTKEYILEQLKEIDEKYKNPKNILSEFKAEQQLVKDYEGRQFLELIQNADDAGINYGPNDVFINLFKENDEWVLEISNTGLPFSEKGLESLLYLYDSPKKDDGETIGHYGLGFRSVISWANKIQIFSGDLSLEFSKANAIEKLLKLYSQNKSKFDKYEGLILPSKDEESDDATIAILPNPKIIKFDSLNGYDTKIKIYCKNDCINKINSAIKDLNENILLFLKYVKNIEIKTDKLHLKFSKNNENGNVIITSNNLKNNLQKITNWIVFNENGNILLNKKKMKYEFKIAFDPKNHTSGEFLYSYFKTDIKCSIPCILHATLSLSSNRNHLIKEDDGVNGILIPKLINFISKTAEDICKLNQINGCESNYDGLSLLNPDYFEESLEKDYKFKTLILEKLKTTAVLPTINNEYVAFDNNKFVPKFSKYKFDKYLKNDDFYDLLKNSDDTKIINTLCYVLSLQFYSGDEFSKRINKNINFYSLEQKNNLIKLLIDSFSSFSEKNYPMLLEDDFGKPIPIGNTVYPVQPQISELSADTYIPQWAHLTILNNKQKDSLVKMIVNPKTVNKNRELIEKLDFLGLKEFNTKSFSELLVRECNNNISKEKVVDFIQYLFKNENILNNINTNNIFVINRENNIVEANKTFLGKEYGNDLGEKILKICNETNFLAPAEIFNLSSQNKNAIKDFWNKLGIKSFPKPIFTDDISFLIDENNISAQYFDYCWPENTSKTVKGEIEPRSRNTIKKEKRIKLNCLTYYDYDTLKRILKELSNETIIAWICKDDVLRHIIENDDNNDSFDVWFPHLVKSRNIDELKISFIKYAFKNIAWIKLDSDFIKPIDACLETEDFPSEIVKSLKLNNNLIRQFSSNADDDMIRHICSKLGIASIISESSPTFIYKMLLNLPKVDGKNNKFYGKSIYSKLKTINNIDEIEKNPYYLEFKQNGEVLTRIGDKLEYVSNSKAYYSDNKIFSKEFLSRINILEMDARVGEEKISKMFGVQTLKNLNFNFSDTQTEIKIHPYDGQFQIDYQELLPYVVAYRPTEKMQKQAINILQAHKIRLIESLNLKYQINGKWEAFSLNPSRFEYFYDKNKKIGYIAVDPDICHSMSYEDLKKKIDFSNSVASLICDFIAVSDIKGTIRELFKVSHDEKKWRLSNDLDCDSTQFELICKNFAIKTKDDKKQFVYAIYSGLKTKSNEYDYLYNLLKTEINISIFESINFDEINNPKNIPFIFEILKRFKKDLPEVNSFLENKIDIKEYNSKILCKYKFENKLRYWDYFYIISEKNYEKFNELRNKFANLNINIKNSIYFLPDDEINLALEIKNDVWNQTSEKHINEIYLQQKAKYGDLTNILCLSNDDQFCYILFNKKNTAEEKITNESVKETPPVNLDDLKNDAIPPTTIAVFEQPSNSKKTKDSKGAHKKSPKRSYRESETTKINNGKISEFSVYRGLKEKFNDVEWVSQNSKDIMRVDGDDSLGYDIRYTDQNGIKKYVEVKSTSSDFDGDVHFILSLNELKFAEKNPKDYIVYFVLIKDGHAIKHIELGNIFNYSIHESFLANDKFHVVDKDYEIKMSVKKDE